MTSHVRVAIVGAGIAGLAAARRLSEGGLDVTLFDKGRRPGGRASTRRRDLDQFDHGAQYFTVRDRRFADVVEGLVERGDVAPWRPRLATIDVDGISPASSSVERYVGVPGMDAVADALATPLDVRSGVRIAAIERVAGTWLARDESGAVVSESDVLLVTAPPSQALDLVGRESRIARDVDPERLSPCWALLVSFDEPFDPGFDAAFVNAGPLRWIACDSSKPGRPPGSRWVVHATPDWSREHLERERDEAAEIVMQELRRTLDLPLPRAASIDAHRWRYAIPTEGEGVGPLWDPEQRLGVCGDWCRREGRIEGAFLSGDGLAERIAQGG